MCVSCNASRMRPHAFGIVVSVGSSAFCESSDIPGDLVIPLKHCISTIVPPATLKLSGIVIWEQHSTGCISTAQFVVQLFFFLYHEVFLLRAGLCMQMVLKCADIGHLAVDLKTHKRWAYQLEEEFFRQVLLVDSP